MTLPTPPLMFRTLEEANKYLRDLHRNLELQARPRAANKIDYQLGTFTEDYDLSTALTTAELQVIVQTLIANLTNYGALNSKRS